MPEAPGIEERDVVGLRSAVRDLQVSINNYYRDSTGYVDGEQLTTSVRATISFIQKIHEVLSKDIESPIRYQEWFDGLVENGNRHAQLIEAFRYIRQVGQHLLFPVEPNVTSLVGGLGLGYRTSAVWSKIPDDVNARLRKGTRTLRTHYDTHLSGQSVLDSFVEALLFFASVCPEAVHRNETGEWTGFPLRHQAGVATRLHPEEPVSGIGQVAGTKEWHDWANGRRPGGERRLICGEFTSEHQLIYGMTFSGWFAFSVFFETASQIEHDIDLGYPYHYVNPERHVTEHEPFFEAGGGRFGPCRVSDVDPTTWLGDPLTALPAQLLATFGSPEVWRTYAEMELGGFLTRRMNRLHTYFPIL